MKFTSDMLFALAAVAPAVVTAAPPAPAPGQYVVKVAISAGTVNVGDFNYDLAIQDWIYAEPGNKYIVIRTGGEPNITLTDQCTTPGHPGHLEVTADIDGRWGQEDGLRLNDARDHLVAAVMRTLHADADRTGYNVFSNCFGTTWEEGVPRWKGAHACGGVNPTVRPTCMCKYAGAQCEFHSWGHIVPSAISAGLYRDNQPLSPYLKVNFHAKAIEKNEECDKTAKALSKLVGFLPGPGNLFSTTIEIFCDHGL